MVLVAQHPLSNASFYHIDWSYTVTSVSKYELTAMIGTYAICELTAGIESFYGTVISGRGRPIGGMEWESCPMDAKE